MYDFFNIMYVTIGKYCKAILPIFISRHADVIFFILLHERIRTRIPSVLWAQFTKIHIVGELCFGIN